MLVVNGRGECSAQVLSIVRLGDMHGRDLCMQQ
jgi:hypothetical protein